MPSLVQSQIDDAISRHLGEVRASGGADAAKYRECFAQAGMVLLTDLLPQSVKLLLATEICTLAEEFSIRRNLQLAETSNSERKMCNVTADEVRRHGGAVHELYHSPAFQGILQEVAGENLHACPYLPEQYVINQLVFSGDTHGWHWDDYSFGVIFIAECPPIDHGGFLQTVTNTVWNKSSPQVYRYLIDNPIRSYELQPGDLYLLRTDTTLHRVHPISSGRRTIVNMAYAADRDLHKSVSHETMETLFKT